MRRKILISDSLFQSPPDWTEILTYFRGSELQNYFTKILEDDLKAVIKPQYVDQIPKAVKGSVQQLLDKKDELKKQDEVNELLELTKVKSRNVADLSGGELQRFVIAMVCIQVHPGLLYQNQIQICSCSRLLISSCLMNLHLTWM